MDPLAEIAWEVANLRPRLSERQRAIVDEVVDGFLAADASGLALRYVRAAAANPDHVGFDPSVRFCGCDNGFRIVDSTGPTLIVERCRVCSNSEPIPQA